MPLLSSVEFREVLIKRAASPPAPPPPGIVITNDFAFWNFTNNDFNGHSSFWTWVNPFNKTTNVYGTNYTESITVFPATFPSGTVATWSWPAVIGPSNVYSTLVIGGYGNNGSSVIPHDPILPFTTNQLTTFTSAHNLTLAGGFTANFLVQYAFPLYDSSSNGNVVANIAILPHVPTYQQTILNGIGTTTTFTDANAVSWKLFKSSGAGSPGFKQGTSASPGSGTSTTLAFTGAVTAGNMLVCAVRTGSTSSAPSFSDSVNGAWAAPTTQQDTYGGDTLFIGTFPNTAAGTPTVTTSWTTSGSIRIAIAEYVATAVDQKLTQDVNTPAATFSTPNATTTSANEVILAINQGNTGWAETSQASGSNPASGWNRRFTVDTGKLVWDDVVVSSTGTYHETWSVSPNTDAVSSAILTLTVPVSGVPTIYMTQNGYADLINNTFDIKALLGAAVSAGWLTGNEWFTGMALGINVQQQSGTVTVNSLAVTYTGKSVSPDGATIPPLVQITDTSLNIWTVVGGVIQENGSNAGVSSNVILLLWFGGLIYQQNNANLWWSWNGTTWVAQPGDPRVSPSGTAIPPATSIVDQTLATWTVTAGGVVQKNGVNAGTSSNVILLLYYQNVMYYENSSNAWFTWGGSSWTSRTGDPRAGSGPTVVLNTDGVQYNLLSSDQHTPIPTPFWASSNPWNKGSLVRGVDYTSSVTCFVNTFPDGTQFNWSWPSATASGGVYSFDDVGFDGVYSGHSFTPIVSQQINSTNMVQIIATHSITQTSGTTNDYHVIYDFNITPSNTGGIQGSHGTQNPENAVFVLVGPGDISFLASGSQPWTFTDAWGTLWKASVTSVPMWDWIKSDGTNYTNGQIDFLYMFRLAASHGWYSAALWFNGLSIGAEPARNSGGWTLNKFVMEYNGITYAGQGNNATKGNSGPTIFSPSVALASAVANPSKAMRVIVKLASASQGFIRLLFCPNQTIGGTNTDFGHMGVGKWSGANATTTTQPIEVTFNSGGHGISPNPLPSGASARWSDWINVSALTLNAGDSIVITFDNGAAGGSIRSTGNTNSTLWTSGTLGNWNVATGDGTNGFTSAGSICQGIFAIQTNSAPLTNLP